MSPVVHVPEHCAIWTTHPCCGGTAGHVMNCLDRTNPPAGTACTARVEATAYENTVNEDS